METSKSLLAVLFFMGVISASSAYVFTVGGRIGWVENPLVPYSSWSGSMRFNVNDTLVFNYKQGDSVLVVKKESYDSCNVTNPLQKLDSGVYKLDHSGPHYFISGAAGHCSNGEKLLVVVLAIRNPPSPPALAPPAPAPVVSPAPSSLSPSPTPASVTAPAPAPSSLSPSPTPASVTAPAPAPAPSSLSPSPTPASVTAPAPAPSSLSPSPSPASVTAPAPAPSSSSPSPVSIPAPAPGPSSVSPAPSSSSLSPSPGSFPVPSPPQPGSAPAGSPSGSLAPPPSTNSSPVLRMSFGLVALVIGCTLMI